ncbi:MAG: LysR family transcriptional regulator [Pseudomonadota bacterium]
MTYRLPSLNTLRAFEAAARHLSFKTAAGELGVTPGAVSQQVKKLEGSLGVDLFRRLPHGLLLTDAGETYLPRITQLFEDLTEATEEIAPKLNGKKFAVGLSAKAKAALPDRWPNGGDELSSYVREVIQTSDVSLVRTGEIDCLIQLGGGPFDELTVSTLATQNGAPLTFICKPALAECRQSKAILESLQTHTHRRPKAEEL